LNRTARIPVWALAAGVVAVIAVALIALAALGIRQGHARVPLGGRFAVPDRSDDLDRDPDPDRDTRRG